MESHGIYFHTSLDKESQRKNEKDLKKALNSCRRAIINNYQRTTATTGKTYFRHIFMHITLPTGGVYRNESSIVNLNNADGPGTHRMAYAKRGDHAVYFDNFGNFRSPKELMRYLNVTQIEYNRTPYQRSKQL